MTTGDKLSRIIDGLKDACRPMRWAESFPRPIAMLEQLAKDFVEDRPMDAPRIDRIVANLRVGMILLKSEPEALFGYCKGAIAELTWLRGEIPGDE